MKKGETVFYKDVCYRRGINQTRPNASTFGKGLKQTRPDASTFGKGLKQTRPNASTFGKGLIQTKFSEQPQQMKTSELPYNR